MAAVGGNLGGAVCCMFTMPMVTVTGLATGRFA